MGAVGRPPAIHADGRRGSWIPRLAGSRATRRGAARPGFRWSRPDSYGQLRKGSVHCLRLVSVRQAARRRLMPGHWVDLDRQVFEAVEPWRRRHGESVNDLLRRAMRLDEIRRPAEPGPDLRGRPWIGDGVRLPHGTELRMTHAGRTWFGRIGHGAWLVGGGASQARMPLRNGSPPEAVTGRRVPTHGWLGTSRSRRSGPGKFSAPYARGDAPRVAELRCGDRAWELRTAGVGWGLDPPCLRRLRTGCRGSRTAPRSRA